VLGVLQNYYERRSLRFLREITIEVLDEYVIARRKPSATRLKEIEILRQFFNFCIKRKWTHENPAVEIERPRLRERDEIVPYAPDEVIRILTACAGSAETVMNAFEPAPSYCCCALQGFASVML
jgi:site-specific recombinase XerD